MIDQKKKTKKETIEWNRKYQSTLYLIRESTTLFHKTFVSIIGVLGEDTKCISSEGSANLT